MEKNEQNGAQPKVLIDAMREVTLDRYEYADQYAVKLKLENWRQKAQIEGLKKEIEELRKAIFDLRAEKE